MNKVFLHCIDPGHGGTDPGAVGKHSQEETIALLISKIVGRILLEQGQKVLFTRTTDKYLTLAQRADISNKASCSTFISIHCNSNQGTPGEGIETYSHPTSTNGLKLSKCVQAEIVNATKLKNRGSKTANYGVLRMSKAVAILVETAFINNPNEEILLMQSFYQEKLALAIVKGIFKYLGLEFKEKVITPATKMDPKILELQKLLNKFGATDQNNKKLDEDGLIGHKTKVALNKLVLKL